MTCMRAWMSSVTTESVAIECMKKNSVCLPLSTMLKHLLLQNCSADQSQILCGASLARGYEILFVAYESHNQDGRNAHIW